jgi:hypothetical protein
MLRVTTDATQLSADDADRETLAEALRSTAPDTGDDSSTIRSMNIAGGMGGGERG